jgi:NitT/TauT family transport system substrate-binding protein
MPLPILPRKVCLAALAFAAALLLGGAHAATPAATPAPIKIALATWIGFAPFHLANALKLYRKHGLDVSLQTFADPEAIPAALASGAVDGALVTYDQVILAADRGQRFKVVLPVDYSNGGDAIVAARPIARVTDLKGKKVAYSPLSPSDFLLGSALRANGMSRKDITPVHMTPEEVPAALAAATVAAGVTYQPNVGRILAGAAGKQFQIIYSSKDAPGLIADVLVFDARKIEQNGKQIQAIVSVYLEALAYLRANPAAAAKLIGKAYGISAKEVGEQLAGVYNIPRQELLKPYINATATTSYYSSGALINEILLAAGQIKKPVDIAGTFDDRFVKALAR